MREIKFRVWSKVTEKMSDWEFIHSVRNLHKLMTLNHIDLMQFTGLKDENGKEIYEGDIVKMKDVEDNIERIGFVDFNDGSFRINCGFITCYRWMDYEVEVIGNIYQNKELLNDE